MWEVRHRGALSNSLGFSTGYWEGGGVFLESGESREMVGRNTAKVSLFHSWQAGG